MRLFAFILALLLLGGSMDPTRNHLILLTVITGIAWMRIRPWNLFQPRPEIDLRFAGFLIAVLLLAGTIDPTKGWLIALTVVTGLSIFMPRLFAIDPLGFNDRGHGRWHRSWHWDWDWDWPESGDEDEGTDRRWRRWERRMNRRWQRHADRFGDDWP
jgi:hypothetical protein